MATSQDIAALMAQLGAMNYQAPSSYKGYQSGYVAPQYRPVNLTDWNFTQKDFKSLEKKKKDDKKNKVDLKPDLWGILDGTLGNIAGFGTSMVDKMMDIWQNPEKYTNIDDELGIKNKFLIGADALLQAPINVIGDTAWDFTKEIGKGQWKSWTDGKLSWGDIPLVGGLDSLAKSKTRKEGKDIVERVAPNMKDGFGKTALGIGADILFDPLTYATVGISAAGKISKAAEIAEMGKIAKSLGITKKFKNADDFIEEVANVTRAKYATKYPNLAEKMVTKKTGEAAAAIKAARTQAFNANVNSRGFSVPFTNKVAVTGQANERILGGMMKNPLYRSEATMANHMDVVDDLLRTATQGDAALQAQIVDAAKLRYGVDDLANMTKTQFGDLADTLNKAIKTSKLPDVATTQKVISEVMPDEVFNKMMDAFRRDAIPWKDVSKLMDNILAQVGTDPALRASFGSQMAEMVSKYWANKSPKNFSGVANARKAESMKWAANLLKESDELKRVVTQTDEVFKNGTKLTDGTSKLAQGASKALDDLAKPFDKYSNTKMAFEHGLDKINPFNARTLKTKDSLVNSMANHIADANTRRIGDMARHTVQLEKIQKAVKGFSKDDMQKVIYAIEKKAPDHMGGHNWKPDDKVKKVATMIEGYLRHLGDEDMAAGVLSRLRRAYFPHVTRMTEEAQGAIENFAKNNPEAAKLVGQKATSGYNKSRKSFETLADRDNYIYELEKAIQKATDDDTINALRQQQAHVADIFETNVVEALQRRTAEGVRAGAAKAMQKELSKYGMMKSVPKTQNYNKAGMVELDDATAKKMGLNTNQKHYMNESVLDGMKKVDEIFTNQNMNKLARHMGALNDIWRPLVTYYKPSHYVNNAIGNTMVNMVAGVSLGDYKKSAKLLQKWNFNRDALTKAEREIMEKAHRHNVIAGGFLFDSKRTWDFNDTTKLEKFADMVGENKAIKIGRKGGEHIDDMYRMANFVNGIRKYGDTAKAAEQVRTYLFNYNELTNADRHMRVMVPFWNWTKNNLPLQAKMLLEQPKFAANINRFYQLFNEDAEVPEGREYLLKGNNFIKIGDKTHTSIQNPVNDLNLLLDPLSIISSTNPVVKSALELQTNHKFFNDKPITYGSDTVAEEDIPKYLVDQTGIGKNIYELLNGDKSFLETLGQLVKPTQTIDDK